METMPQPDKVPMEVPKGMTTEAYEGALKGVVAKCKAEYIARKALVAQKGFGSLIEMEAANSPEGDMDHFIRQSLQDADLPVEAVDKKISANDTSQMSDFLRHHGLSVEGVSNPLVHLVSLQLGNPDDGYVRAYDPVLDKATEDAQSATKEAWRKAA